MTSAGAMASQPSETTTTLSTTTLVPGITQPFGLAPLDLLTRFPMQHLLLERFSPNTILADRYISPFWLPFTLIGCTVCTVVYAFVNWKWSSDRSLIRNKLTRTPASNLAQSTYLTSLSIVQLIRAIHVILLDLDTAWDSGLLAWNQLFCPLGHTVATASKLAIALLTLALGVECLAGIYSNSIRKLCSPIRWCLASGRYRKSVHITVALVLVCLGFGLIETAYWRVQYYLPNSHTSLGLAGEQMSLGGAVPRPLARCEVTGNFHHMFKTRVERTAGFADLMTDQYDTSTRLAASYADFKWINVLTVDCALSLASICVALIIIRAQLMANWDRINTNAAGIHLRREPCDLGHVAALCLIQGLCLLPEELFTMLEPLTRPGEVNLTDAEIELDGTWQRYFMMLTARVISHELADITGALMLPVCLGFSAQFRREFCQIFGCWCLSNCGRPLFTKWKGKTTTSKQGLSSSSIQEPSRGFPVQYSRRQPQHHHQFIPGLEQVVSPGGWKQPLGKADHARGEVSRPFWKWGRGWIMSNPAIDRSSNNNNNTQGARRHTGLTGYGVDSSRALYHPVDAIGMHPNRARTPGLKEHIGQRDAEFGTNPNDRRRSASVNDLFYYPHATTMSKNTSHTLSHIHSKVDWFEPRSYV